MNKELEKIKAIFKQFLPGKKIGYVPHQVTRSWIMSIVVAVFIGLVLSGVGVYQFFVIREAEVVRIETENVPVQTFSKERLLKIVGEYQGQVTQFIGMRSTPIAIPDTGSEKVEVVEEVKEEVVSEEGEYVEEGAIEENLEDKESGE
jgi:hypothetical protein